MCPNPATCPRHLLLILLIILIWALTTHCIVLSTTFFHRSTVNAATDMVTSTTMGGNLKPTYTSPDVLQKEFDRLSNIRESCVVPTEKGVSTPKVLATLSCPLCRTSLGKQCGQIGHGYMPLGMYTTF